jgi:ABC-type phosphate transport system permease subunit
LQEKNVEIGKKSREASALAITPATVIGIYALLLITPKRTFEMFGLAEHRWVSQEWQPQQIFKVITCFDCISGRFIP